MPSDPILKASSNHPGASKLSASAKDSAVVKRSVVVDGHKTSVSLEDAFWSAIKDIAARRNLTLSALIATIDTHRRTNNLSSAIRLFVLEHFRTRAMSAMFIGERVPATPTRAAPSIVPGIMDTCAVK
jgi:predicted DNA-binding ribbon-helix-helix protein